jgi:hypothetical protein
MTRRIFANILISQWLLEISAMVSMAMWWGKYQSGVDRLAGSLPQGLQPLRPSVNQ